MNAPEQSAPQSTAEDVFPPYFNIVICRPRQREYRWSLQYRSTGVEFCRGTADTVAAAAEAARRAATTIGVHPAPVTARKSC